LHWVLMEETGEEKALMNPGTNVSTPGGERSKVKNGPVNSKWGTPIKKSKGLGGRNGGRGVSIPFGISPCQIPGDRKKIKGNRLGKL